MTVIVTGASGPLGRLVAENLLARLAPAELVLVTRHPAALSALAARGADVRFGDFDDPASLPKAFAGGRRMLLVSTDAVGRRVAQHRAAIDAAAAAGVGHVVYTSHVNPVAGNPIGPVAEEHGETEEMLHDRGPAWTVLRFGSFAELQVQPASLAVAAGQLVSNAGEGRIVPVSRRDCADAAATVLTTDGHEARTYEITGPQALSQRDLAGVFAEVSGRSVKVVQIGDRMLVWGLVRYGAARPVARAVAAFGRALREGYFDVIDPAFESLTGRPPLSLREVLIPHRGDLLAAA
ncbi:MAG: family NAD(P)-dependent oxidoreductase [Chloroflexi bacterium]|jgi:NAD(P)H dehydrogenase (quinone)|nr:family NAD(P)-dependent oxidoreductase [Chloroflexota bacterium]